MPEEQKSNPCSDKYVPPPMDPYATYQTPYERRQTDEPNPFIEFRRFADKQFASMFENIPGFPGFPKMLGMEDEMKNIRNQFEREMEAMREHRKEMMDAYTKQGSRITEIKDEAEPLKSAIRALEHKQEKAHTSNEPDLPSNWERATTSDGRTYFIDWQTGQASKSFPAAAATTASTTKSTLPKGWEESVAKNGRTYFINHNDRSTTWLDPRTQDIQRSECPDPSSSMALPKGWEARKGKDGRTYFISHNDRATTWIDPRETSEKAPQSDKKPLTRAEKREIWRRGFKNCPELRKTGDDTKENDDGTELSQYQYLTNHKALLDKKEEEVRKKKEVKRMGETTNSPSSAPQQPQEEKALQQWLLPSLGHDGKQLQRQLQSKQKDKNGEEGGVVSKGLDPIGKDEDVLPFLAANPYSPFRLMDQPQDTPQNPDVYRMREALRNHKPWLDAFEDLMALERTGQLPPQDDHSKHKFLSAWLEARSSHPSTTIFMENRPVSFHGRVDDGGLEENYNTTQSAEGFDPLVWPSPDSVMSSMKAVEDERSRRNNSRRLIRSQKNKKEKESEDTVDTAADARPWADARGPSSAPKSEEKKNLPSIVATMTRTSSRTLSDGSFETKRVLRNKFSDGREETEESVDITPFRKGATFPSAENGKPATEHKKMGWFWN